VSPRRDRLPTRWKIFGTTVLALLAGTLWLRYRTGPHPALPPPAPPPYAAVAVRRFLNIGPDTAAEALGASLADDVALGLGRVAGVRPADGASVRAAARASGDPRELGRRLGVASVLEGDLRRTGDRVRITVHLVSVDRGFDLWSETFEQPALQLLGVRDSIVHGVVTTVRPQARVRPSPGTSGAAYLAYLRGRAALAAGDDSLGLAPAVFREALKLDSAYAPAWSGLAETYLGELLTGARAPSESGPPAIEAAERALALDSLDLRALVARGALRFVYEHDWAGAADDLRRAAALDPGRTSALHWASHLSVATGRLDSSFAASREALERSPFDPALWVHLAWHHAMAREDTLARAALARAADSTARLDGHAALLAELSPDTAASMAWLAAAVAAAPGRVDLLAELARLEALSGRSAEARDLLARLQRLADARYVSPYALAIVYAALRETRSALTMLGRAVDERDPAAVDLLRDPRLAAVRQDFRFAGVARRLAPDSAAIGPRSPASPRRSARSLQ
jgi:TolB-like protein/tetratricopeptide (TPR) repeat protein